MTAVFDLSRLELVTALLTGAAAVTLIPHPRNLIVHTVEFGVWTAFIVSAFLSIASFGDPKIQNATASIVWGGMGLIGMQLSALTSAVGGWTVAHRFVIANWVALGAGVDAFTLAFMYTARAARRTAPRVHLGEWFELPRRVAVPELVPAVDPIAAMDRRLAGALRADLKVVRRRVETSPAIERAAAGASHLLRPGHLRLAMVKLALKINWRREQLAHAPVVPLAVEPQAAAATARPGGAATAPTASTASKAPKRSGESRRKYRGRRQNAARAGGAAPIINVPRSRTAAAARAKQEVATARVDAFQDRAAS